jgi:hypothetical protein
MTKLTKNTEASLEELASITSRTKSWINKLAADGYFKSERHGTYRIGNVIAGLLKHANEQKRAASASGPGQQRLLTARAEDVELRTRIRAGDLIEFKEHTEINDVVYGTFKSELASLGSEIATQRRDPALRREIEDAVDRRLKKASDTFAKLSGEMQAEAMGIKPPATDAENPDDE